MPEVQNLHALRTITMSAKLAMIAPKEESSPAVSA
jgi:hypothetical protein